MSQQGLGLVSAAALGQYAAQRGLGPCEGSPRVRASRLGIEVVVHPEVLLCLCQVATALEHFPESIPGLGHELGRPAREHRFGFTVQPLGFQIVSPFVLNGPKVGQAPGSL